MLKLFSNFIFCMHLTELLFIFLLKENKKKNFQCVYISLFLPFIVNIVLYMIQALIKSEINIAIIS